jgi:hypothetical protein
MEDKAKEKLKIIQLYQKVFSGPDGKKVLEDLMRTHHYLGSTFGGKVENEIYFKEGERNVVLRILALLKLDVKQIQERIDANV